MNNTNYPLMVKSQLEKLNYNEVQKKLLHYHQFIVKEFFTHSELRGLLICHGMGQGKTRLAVSIAEHYRNHDPSRKIIVLCPKSLEANFKNTITTYSSNVSSADKYKFISLNANNMYKQMSQVDEYDAHIAEFSKHINRLNNVLLIIDEAHNFFNSITNGSKNAVGLYDLIMKSLDCRLLFLTGTPIINDPFELVPCFNMLRGVMSKFTDGKIENIVGGKETKSKNKKKLNLTNKNISNVNIVDANIVDIVDKDTSYDDIRTNDIGVDENKSPTADNTGVNEPNKSTDKVEKNTKNNKIKVNKMTNDTSNKYPVDKNNEDDVKSSVDEDNRIKKKHIKKIKTTDAELLFPESYEDFEKFFYNLENNKNKNKEKFTNRIYGLSSYFGDIYFNENKKDFPIKLPTKIEKIPMSETQFSRYLIYRHQEIEESKNKFHTTSGRFSSSGNSSSSTYRVKTRQVSNYCIPEYALGPVRGKKTREKFIDKISEKDLLDTDTYSPKDGRIIANIKKHSNQTGIVYSQFVQGEGLEIFARILEAHGWERFYDKNPDLDADIHDIKKSKRNTFAVLSGNVEIEQRMKIIEVFNSMGNAQGKIISLLLLSGALAEGIDLKRVRHVHKREPFWNDARSQQVETRAIRYRSHIDLPKDQQNVQVYVYLSDYPVKYPNSKITEPTTDIELYENSIKRMQLINDFLLALAESSIDCTIHKKNLDATHKNKINCKMCSPTGEFMYHPIINKDMEMPSTCVAYTEKKIHAKEIKYLDDIYYYTTEPILNIYTYSKQMSGYIPIDVDHPHYADIVSQIV